MDANYEIRNEGLVSGSRGGRKVTKGVDSRGVKDEI
jgi:hypothetical protein